MNLINTQTYYTKQGCRVTERTETFPNGDAHREIILSVEDNYTQVDCLTLEAANDA